MTITHRWLALSTLGLFFFMVIVRYHCRPRHGGRFARAHQSN